MNFPLLGLISISILLSALSRCNQGCTPIFGLRPMYEPCSFQTNVSISPLIGGHLAAVCSRGFPISDSVQAAPSQSPVSVELFRLSCILCCIASLPSFLSCITGNTFSPTPIPPAHSPKRELCLFSLSSLCCPWGYVTVFCNAGN